MCHLSVKKWDNKRHEVRTVKSSAHLEIIDDVELLTLTTRPTKKYDT